MATRADDIPPPRNGARKRVLMRGTLFTPHGAFVIWIRDISNTGALVTCKDKLPLDCDVIFKRGPIFAAAHVAWSNDTGAGVKFYRDLNDDTVAAATLPIPGHVD
jgi:PilZ domain-containing protein